MCIYTAYVYTCSRGSCATRTLSTDNNLSPRLILPTKTLSCSSMSSFTFSTKYGARSEILTPNPYMPPNMLGGGDISCCVAVIPIYSPAPPPSRPVANELSGQYPRFGLGTILGVCKSTFMGSLRGDCEGDVFKIRGDLRRGLYTFCVCVRVLFGVGYVKIKRRETREKERKRGQGESARTHTQKVAEGGMRLIVHSRMHTSQYQGSDWEFAASPLRGRASCMMGPRC